MFYYWLPQDFVISRRKWLCGGCGRGREEDGSSMRKARGMAREMMHCSLTPTDLFFTETSRLQLLFHDFAMFWRTSGYIECVRVVFLIQAPWLFSNVTIYPSYRILARPTWVGNVQIEPDIKRRELASNFCDPSLQRLRNHTPNWKRTTGPPLKLFVEKITWHLYEVIRLGAPLTL